MTLPAEHMDDKPCPYITGTVTRYCTLTPFTLTDEERRAIHWAATMLEVGSLPNSLNRDDAATLRSLLERTKCATEGE